VFPVPPDKSALYVSLKDEEVTPISSRSHSPYIVEELELLNIWFSETKLEDPVNVPLDIGVSMSSL
jgi:hypothetical protein